MKIDEVITCIENSDLTNDALCFLQVGLKRKGIEAGNLLNAMYLTAKVPYDETTKINVENLLKDKTDPMLAGMALKVLISWRLYGDHRDDILEALNGTSWDEDSMFKLEGVHSAAFYLRDILDLDILSAVLKCLLDKNELFGTRYAARDAILSAMGYNQKEIVENTIEICCSYESDKDFSVQWAQRKIVSLNK